MIKGKEYTIEVIDVTEAADACLLRVNGDFVIIDEGETKKINGLRIFVADVRAFRSFLQENDVCQIIIA